MTEQLQFICCPGNKRPTRTPEMRRQAAVRLVSEMVKTGTVESSDAEATVSDIVKATRFETFDGYKIARELEKWHHWDCDMEIAEQLGEFGGILNQIYDAAEKTWAAENPNEPKFSDGMVVMWRGKPATLHGIYEYRPQCYKVRE
ncbi:MAG: hypothetical protein WAM53_15185, partial [Terrimicrobiaceae bacterium]